MESAVAIARRNPRDVPELDMVSSLGEAAIAAGFDGNYARAFDYIEEAYSLMAREFNKTVNWKMRFVLLGNALGYFSSMAIEGNPPSSNYTVPHRGQLISYNETIADWYDEADYEKFDLAPTLMAMFANTVGRDGRAIYWANKGIDDARAKGVLACINSLAEVLIPTLIMQGELDQALDYAFESSMAITAAVVACREVPPDIREPQDAIEILGPKPNDDWNQAEQHYLLTGVIPAILFCCVNEEASVPILEKLAAHCSAKANDASNADSFLAVSDSIAFLLANGRSAELHSRALRDNERNNRVGMAVNYLLSSFAEDADLKLAIVQHALVMQDFSSVIQGSSVLWKFFTDQLTVFWCQKFEKGRFRFSNPALVEIDLKHLDQIEPENRVKRLIQIIFSGLSVRLPAQLKSTSEWLRN